MLCKRDFVLTGVWVHPISSPKEILECARQLDAHGIGQLWIGDEGVSYDPFSLLAVCAATTQNIELGVAVTNPILRHPAMVAASAVTIAEIGGNRMILGWGTGGDESLGPFGAVVESPVRTLRTAIEMSTAVLNARKCDGYSPPSHAVAPMSVRQYIGARGPNLNSLASSIADGVFLSGLEETELRDRINRAHSVRDIEITICQTIRESGPQEHGTIVGNPRSIAERLHSIADSFGPRSICLACVDDVPLSRKTEFSLAIFEEFELLRS